MRKLYFDIERSLRGKAGSIQIMDVNPPDEFAEQEARDNGYEPQDKVDIIACFKSANQIFASSIDMETIDRFYVDGKVYRTVKGFTNFLRRKGYVA